MEIALQPMKNASDSINMAVYNVEMDIILKKDNVLLMIPTAQIILGPLMIKLALTVDKDMYLMTMEDTALNNNQGAFMTEDFVHHADPLLYIILQKKFVK